jgi:uncharacterized protein YhaN
VKILKLRVRGYKRFRDLELDLDHDRVLVLGPNEAGKSTLAEALLVGIFGLAPMRRGSGHGSALQQVAPWEGGAAGLSLTYRLDSGRLVEADWDLSGEQTRVIDLETGQDITAEFEGGTHGWVDCGAALTGLPGSVFSQVTSVGEGQLATIGDDADIRESLLRLADSGIDVLVEQAVARLQEGARQATIPRTTSATRRNQLGKELSAAEAELAVVQSARAALDEEVHAIQTTEIELEHVRQRFIAASVEEARRQEERGALRRDIDRGAGRLAEAELRLAALAPDQPGADLAPWTDAELDAARQVLATAIERPRMAIPWAGAAISLLGLLVIVLGLLERTVALDAAGAIILAIGVFALTQPQLGNEPKLIVGARVFADRRALMVALDQERARREYESQHSLVLDLEEKLNSLVQQQGTPAAAAGTRVPLSELNDEQLETRLLQVGEQQTQLTLQLERQRASLERGARQIPEISPLEETCADLRQRIERLETFGAACDLAAKTLALASHELRRAYAPRLQAYLADALARVTDGRYREALVTDAFEVLVRAPESGSMVDVRKLSRGTQQQVYLLLRLALLDTMGAGSERLPMFLDDALALADDPRRAGLLRVLGGEDRQVIYFTALEGAAALFGPEWRRVELPAPAIAKPAASSDDEDAGAGEEGLVSAAVEHWPGAEEGAGQ